MLFDNEFFRPELSGDRRTRAALAESVGVAGTTVEIADLVAGAVRVRDARLLDTLARALRPGRSMDDLFAAADSRRFRPNGHDPAFRTRSSFSPAALAALDELELVLSGGGEALSDVALEVFAGCVLKRLRPQEADAWSMLDADRALLLLRRQVGRALECRQRQTGGPAAMGGEVDDQEPSPDGPFLLPAELAPSEDLTHRAREAIAGLPAPFSGEPQYERLFDAICRALHRRPGGHVLVSGERGVGTSTVLVELARRAAAGEVPFLQDKRFVLADCRYTAPEESRQRLLALLGHVAHRRDLVLCVEGFGALIRGDRGTSNRPLLLSALLRVQCRILGLVTPREYEELVADEPDMLESFAQVEAQEPDVETAQELLAHFAVGLEEKFDVTIEPEAVRRAVVLSANYILNERLPTKALKILHRVCEGLDYERSQRKSPRGTVTADDVIEAVSRASGVPQETLRGVAEKVDYRQSLSEAILGQEHAVREVATELGLIKAGLTDPGKPASVMLFVGQTGTGKTEMAKALARFYSTSKRLRTYTLGNFVEPHSVAGIIGVPPGYVGHDQGGRLVNDLNADPYCVFLLDEADKAHPDVLQPFLNLFDEGWVRDQRGVQAFADKSIFILTTNVGQRMIADLAAKGESMEEITRRMKEALSQIRHSKSNRPVFTPEFLARLKRVIVFNPLDREAMHGISRKLVAEMQETWRTKRAKELVVPGELVAHVADRAHDVNEKSKGKEGGRIVRKLLADWIEAAVQRETSEHPTEYRLCEAVVLGFAPPPDGTTAAPQITVSFEKGPPRESESGSAAEPAPSGERSGTEAPLAAEAATDVSEGDGE